MLVKGRLSYVKFESHRVTSDRKRKKKVSKRRERSEAKVITMTVSGILYHSLQQSAKNDKSEVRTGFLCVDMCTCVYTLLHLII